MTIIPGKLFDLISMYPDITNLKSEGGTNQSIFDKEDSFYVESFPYPTAVLLDDGVPVGLCFGDMCDDNWKETLANEPHPHLQFSTFISPEYRRKGWGTSLFNMMAVVCEDFFPATIFHFWTVNGSNFAPHKNL